MSDYTTKIMVRIRERFTASGLKLEELGRKMGYSDGSARRSAWQFLNKTADPRLSMVEKAATALGTDVKDLLD